MRQAGIGNASPVKVELFEVFQGHKSRQPRIRHLRVTKRKDFKLPQALDRLDSSVADRHTAETKVLQFPQWHECL